MSDSDNSSTDTAYEIPDFLSKFMKRHGLSEESFLQARAERAAEQAAYAKRMATPRQRNMRHLVCTDHVNNTWETVEVPSPSYVFEDTAEKEDDYER
ncbi:hypothetical protein [Acidithiobacillus thiooxidans]|uniref:hypothetical protein n=1 Tax=Acidithiobacillus thiooxidans TaxID=930 RepID=UPI0004E21CA0|nr:hypothetical protein [Acidithiobacillus thiooxidans]